jgi:hypothetical protein
MMFVAFSNLVFTLIVFPTQAIFPSGRAMLMLITFGYDNAGNVFHVEYEWLPSIESCRGKIQVFFRKPALYPAMGCFFHDRDGCLYLPKLGIL